MRDEPKAVLVLGIGNLLWADEGFGVRVVEELDRRFRFPSRVRLLDGGTQGIYLVQDIRETDILVVFDAIDYGLVPGTLKLIHDDDVPAFLGAKKMSLHQTGFQEVLAMAAMLGDYPAHILLVGVQPAQLEDFGGSLTDSVKAQIEPAIAAALDYLAKFDICPTAREDRPQTDLTGELSLGRYEGERPSEAAACRTGDERILAGLGKGDPDLSGAPN
ncbi:HyaD/HybD family hydrogenase maturation endopeptidase [Dongia sp.]|uniref:HyaD/HybD family hydrogenase maturation endopeptidase n=1 Tax=Dongia sp. TaxID=1977262 RepID=UPI0035AE1595